MADAGKRMVVGFNHNIKHKGRPYHVQTEDSGLDNPHVTTHLFVGGNILASKKTSYAEQVGAEGLAKLVRGLMEEQHKEMLRNLINGAYDDVDAAYAQQARSFQPGEIRADGRTVQLQPSMTAAPRTPAGPAPATAPAITTATSTATTTAVPPAPGRPLPPEVVAARREPSPAYRSDGAETLFGEDLISEKSLDEVILSYLAEDLGERR